MHGPRLEEYYTLSAKNSPASKAYTRAFLAPTQPDGGGASQDPAGSGALADPRLAGLGLS